MFQNRSISETVGALCRCWVRTVVCLTLYGIAMQSPLCRSDCAITLSLLRSGAASDIPAGVPDTYAFRAYRETPMFGPGALLNAYPKSQLTRNRSIVPPLSVRNCCVHNSPRLHSAQPSLYRSGRALLSVKTYTLGQSHKHLAGVPIAFLRMSGTTRRNVPVLIVAIFLRCPLYGSRMP